MTRVQINATAPDFTLEDVQDQTVRLSDYRGDKHVFLVFNRGFVWPFCRRHMVQLRQDYQKFVDRDTEVVAVGPEDSRTFGQYWQKEQIPFVGLPDPDHTVADLYGQEVNPLKLGRMPAQMVIDKKGKIRYAHYGRSMSDIPPNEEILALLDELNQEVYNHNG